VTWAEKDLIADVRAGPPGPRVGAFFDFDGTLVAGMLYPEGQRLVEAHRRAGHSTVLSSSATRFQAAPAARALGVADVLTSPVELVDGVCTGRPGGPLMWGTGKATAVRAYANEHDIDLTQTYAYSNGAEDVPFLRIAGRPRAVNPGRGLAAAARQHGWPMAEFPSARPRRWPRLRPDPAVPSADTPGILGAQP
jgi:phosphoserine phosphatase